MKSTTHQSFLDRRAVLAATLSIMMAGAATANAQTSTGTPGTTRGSAAQQHESTKGTYGTDSATSTPVSATSSSSATSATPSSTDTSIKTDASATTLDTSTTGGATTMTGRDSSGKLGWMERRWVNKVADSGSTEIGLAKLAAEKSTNPEVKSFAQKLVEDHTAVHDELKSLASQKNVKIDEEDLGSDRAYKRLSKKSGTEFDQEFIEHMVDMHETDVKLFEKASTDAKDSALKSFAAKHVDHLRQHLQQAQSLRSSIVPTGRVDDASTSTRTVTEPSTSTSTSTLDATSTSSPSTTPSSTPSSSSSSSTSTSSDSTSSDSTTPRKSGTP